GCRTAGAGIGLARCVALVGCAAGERTEAAGAGGSAAPAPREGGTAPSRSRLGAGRTEDPVNVFERAAQLTDVSGRVTIDGQPMPNGSITFIPADGKGKPSAGEVKDGLYSVKVPPGTAKVAISRPVVVGKKQEYDKPDSPEQPLVKEGLPARYNVTTELTAEVKPGKNAIDFALLSK